MRALASGVDQAQQRRAQPHAAHHAGGAAERHGHGPLGVSGRERRLNLAAAQGCCRGRRLQLGLPPGRRSEAGAGVAHQALVAVGLQAAGVQRPLAVHARADLQGTAGGSGPWHGQEDDCSRVLMRA